ncbi:MAG: PTS ascorbate transporter subunit IIC [Clostridia bacterium]|nr:PTS ascorbate transporter subunit IIC [Clostridia bacterium]
MASPPKKQIPLRLSASLYDALNEWAQDDFRSVNGQIEYLLTQCVRYHQRNGTSLPPSFSPLDEE